ncbi:2Fe-2S iron-sulfur cluster binding domain-containing protein [Mycolicibacterium sp. CBMA 226]|uniref:2Fe-2S iron-sulfur cluster-binding protein n=1 Tax=Mycolicibacterium sp. CBMA 226 TaxID=2606611 RepID=UPI00130669FE|nr:2Fe-2S iron-sulfur cluster binding domain-containing protein [Mycolicibacterium sp. CBMA 226]MUL75600.1 2Fe-2S iron-sulfur cluster binding domain-containing protein [Mycolicibacterium sp. CBMA 226]
MAAFNVVLRRSGRVVRVPPDESVLEALLGAGVRVDSMCHNGLCGTCQTRVVSGHVDHRDSFLTDEERTGNQFMMLCVSRAVDGSDIVLDL